MVQRCLLLVYRYLSTIQLPDFLSAIQFTIQLNDHSAIEHIFTIWMPEVSGNWMPTVPSHDPNTKTLQAALLSSHHLNTKHLNTEFFGLQSGGTTQKMDEMFSIQILLACTVLCTNNFYLKYQMV